MENIDFVVKTVKRIHDIYADQCIVHKKCPLYNFNCGLYLNFLEDLEDLESEEESFLMAIKEWDQKYPIITNREKLKEVFGDFEKGSIFSPEWLDAEYTYRYEKEVEK